MALGSVAVPVSLAADGSISLLPASSECIRALVWAGMAPPPDAALVLVLVVLLSHGGVGPEGPWGIVLPKEPPTVRAPPLSSWAAAPALSWPTVEELESVLEPVPALEEYQPFRTDRLIEPMMKRRTPNPLKDTARGAFTIA